MKGAAGKTGSAGDDVGREGALGVGGSSMYIGTGRRERAQGISSVSASRVRRQTRPRPST